ncbi:hypothetical protein SUGI_0146200 [Cryptomeria japonica]|nr:hypothetical protein SUGI_0146200 [Cryptomeria japonica]
MTVGLQYIGPNFESRIAEIIGPVTLGGFKERARSLSRQKWSYQLGFKGQSKDLHIPSGQSSVQWVKGVAVP